MPGHVSLPDGFLASPFAHRGLHDRAGHVAENSITAFECAVAAGYAIEMDVRRAGDGRAIVFHDALLDRLTSKAGPVRDKSSAELEKIVLLDSPDTIPTLSAVLSRIAGRIPLLIELKDETGDLGPSDGRLENAVAADMRDYRGPAAVMSFSPTTVAHLAEVLPGVPRGLTTDAFDPAEWPDVPPERLAALRRIDADDVGAAFVSHDHRDLASPRIAQLRAQGLPILTWTVRSAQEEATALRRADAITFEGYRPQPGASPPAHA